MTNDERDRLLLEIHSTVHTTKEDVRRHDRTLYGNGQPGLCTRLKELEMKQVINSKWTLGLITVGASLFGGAIAAIVSKIASRLI
jgi:hypothetical protein